MWRWTRIAALGDARHISQELENPLKRSNDYLILILNPEQERLVNEELQADYRSADEVIGRALEALREKEHDPLGHDRKRDPKGAAARIRERRKGVTLGGLKIRDLVNEGRR